MGVGVYHENYHGSGRSINVSGPLPSDDDYAIYLKEYGETEETGMSRQEYDQDAYDFFNEQLLSVVSDTVQSLGFDKNTNTRFGNKNSTFDKDITSIAIGDIFEIGWRSWEHDFVIAIGPSSKDYEEFITSDDNNSEWAVLDKGRGPASLRSDYKEVLDNLETLIRYSLMEASMDTRIRTSGYTSRADEKPENIQEAINDLRSKVQQGLSVLSHDYRDTMKNVSGEERAELSKIILNNPQWDSHDHHQVLIATFNADYNSIDLWNPINAQTAPSLVSSKGVPSAYRDYLTELPSINGYTSIPYTPETKSLYSMLQNTRLGVEPVISAEQYADITGQDCIINIAGDDEKPEILVIAQISPSASVELK